MMIGALFLAAAVGTSAIEEPYYKLYYADDEPRTNRTGIVVIDAGHGGANEGAKGPSGTLEKDVNLLLAKDVRDEIILRGYKVVMTRDEDEEIELLDRPKVACLVEADAFISIHHNATAPGVDPNAVRYETVYAWNEIGERLASAIERKLAQALKGAPESRGVKHANFAVTRNPEIPSCLIEVDFISSPEGEKAILDKARRKETAKAIAEGFADWARL